MSRYLFYSALLFLLFLFLIIFHKWNLGNKFKLIFTFSLLID
ncbi:hypothetical protein PROPEN_00859 [Proteus penneri ATCC 35198]|nr:hypothetical protein PROPEN_00859 [Proteus penneri ATCC 35198]